MSTRVSSAAPAALVVLVVGHFVSLLSAQTVTTIAGGFVGDGGPSKSAALSFPAYAVFDSAGNLLITDSNNNRIRRIDTAGRISTFAGNGKCGFSGDGGAASEAEICNPSGIAIDAAGNIFFADSGNSRIRVIGPAGFIQTLAGNGTFGYCGEGGPARDACLNSPQGIAIVGSGKGQTVYFADTLNNRVRKISTRTGRINIVAGTGIPGDTGDGSFAPEAELNNPVSIALDPSLVFLYISDRGNNKIRRIRMSSQIIHTFFGSQSCSVDLTQLCSPNGIAFDSSQSLYVADSGNGRILKLVPQQSSANLVAGGSPGFNGDGLAATSTLLHFPNSAFVDSQGRLVIVDSSNNRVRRMNSSGEIQTIAGGFIGDGSSGPNAALNGGFFDGLAADAHGNILIADSYDNRIRSLNSSGTISTIAGTGITGSSGDGGSATLATLTDPVAVAVDSSGNTYIASPETSAIRKVDPSGIVSTFASNTFAYGLATDAQGNLYSAGFFTCTITKITPAGIQTVIAGLQFFCGYGGDGGPATSAQLSNPIGVAVDSLGGVYIADWSNNRIRMIDSGGTIDTIAGNGTCAFSGDGGGAVLATLCEPLGVAVDQRQNIFVADTFNFRVRKIAGGVINTIAGSGVSGYNGNHLPALQTNLFPNAVAVKPDGTVLVFDLAPQMVRQIK